MSSHQDNRDEVLSEGVDEFAVPTTAGNRKRAPTERSTYENPPKTRKKIVRRAEVWQHFIQKEDDLTVCNCRYCGIEIGCDSKKVGTSPMKNHIQRCKMYKVFLEKGSQKVIVGDSSGAMTAIKYDKGLFRRSVNEMIVLNELPFAFVESEGFRRFCCNVVPMYTVHCRKTATQDIFAMFNREKDSLKKLFCCDKKRVSLTTDIWVAPTTSYSYMVVTAHWIDVNWVLQKRIISFKPVTDHKGDTIAEHLTQCLDEWGIEKLFTVTVDNAKGNDKALRLFTDALRVKGPNALIRDGAFLHMRCCAHILNLIVKDGLTGANDSIVAIRNAVKYVRSSFARLKSFELRVETGKVSRGSLSLDCTTRWNSTYLMLTAALKLRVAFQKMLEEDKLYNDYFLEVEENGQKRVGPPTCSSWDEVQRLVKFLKIFFNCTLAFSASKTVTSSICYNEIVTIERNLISLSNHKEEVIREEAMAMRKKFEKYWDGIINMNPLVIVASVFDPRNRMQFAGLCFDKLYGKESVESDHLKSSIKIVLRQLFDEYSLMLTKPSQVDTAGIVGHNAESQEPDLLFDMSDDDEYERMDSLYTALYQETANEEPSSELDLYLMEKPVPRNKNSLGLDYDILSWWKQNSPKYPILSEIARDVLALQVSSVASESAFSTSGRILDPFRSCLTPYMIKALICTQQWLRNTIQAEKLANLVQMIEELDFHNSLDPHNQTVDG